MSDMYPSDWSFGELAKSGIDILDGDRGKEYPKETDFYENEFCLFLSAKNVTKSGFKFENKVFITREKDGKLRKGKLVRNDLVITTRGTVGNVAYFDKKVPFENIRINSGMAIIRNIDSEVDSIFLNQLLHSFIIDEQLGLLTSGSAQPQLTIGIVKGLVIPTPPLPEQQKIAAILTSVDNVIETTQAQIDKLKDLKIGMMQELLTTGIGHTEFKDSPVGRIPVGWEVKTIDEFVTKVGSGITPKGGSKAYVARGVPFIRSQNIYSDGLRFDSVCFISKEQHAKMVNSQLQPCDVLLNITGASIGRCYYLSDNYDEGNVNQHVCIIRCKQGLATHIFLTHYLNSEFGQRQIMSLQAGGNREGLNFQQIRAIKTPIPSIEEQLEIAKIVRGIENRIKNHNNKLNAVIKIKKALMQDLLTGKVRVKVD